MTPPPDPPARPGAVLCVGEVLWDSVPDGLHLGGAPFNVAYHLARLGRPARLASRVGDDELGREARRRVRAAGVDASRVQTDDALPTGFVAVTVDADGVPSYEIAEPSAWDAIEADPDTLAAATDSAAVVFGSLAQRDPRSRRTVRAVVAAAPLAVFDVNLRPPFSGRDVVEPSLLAADVVKLSDDELGELAGWFGWPQAGRPAVEELARRFSCRAVCVTRGGDGAAVWNGGRWTEHGGYPVAVGDTVGAGDAFLAGLLSAWLEGAGDEDALDRACRLGGFVASHSGATPAYAVSDLERLGS